MNTYEFGKFLAQLRKEKGLTQVKLAELTGIPKATLGHYFTGENLVTLESLIVICDVFNCSSDEILGRFNEEAYISEILKEHHLNYKEQVSFKELKSGFLRFDFVINKNNNLLP